MPSGCAGSGGAEGDGDAGVTGGPNTVGRPTSNQVSPPSEVAKILPVAELMVISLPLTGSTAKLVIGRPTTVGRRWANRWMPGAGRKFGRCY